MSCTAILIRPDAGAPLRLTSSSAGALSLVVPRSVTAHGVYSFVGAKRKGLGRPADRPFGCQARLTERGLVPCPVPARRQDALSPIVSSQCDMAVECEAEIQVVVVRTPRARPTSRVVEECVPRPSLLGRSLALSATGPYCSGADIAVERGSIGPC